LFGGQKCAPKQTDVLIHSRPLGGLASVCFRPNWQGTGKDFIVICHKGTHTTWEWLLNAQAVYYPLWETHVDQVMLKDTSKKVGAELKPTTAITSIWDDLFKQEYGLVHLGFLAYWLSTRCQVREAVESFLDDGSCKDPILLVIGHSLGSGAAIAGLLQVHRDVKNMMKNRSLAGDMHVVLAGAPRSATTKYNGKIKGLKTDSVLKLAEFTRYVFEQDVVRPMKLV
jgi:hypothetical protein